MSTCNRLDLQTLGSQPVMPQNLPDRWPEKAPKVVEILVFHRYQILTFASRAVMSRWMSWLIQTRLCWRGPATVRGGDA